MALRDLDEAPANDALSTALTQLHGAMSPYLAAGAPLLARLENLQARLLSGRLQLAVLGQFKRGKSSFLNALLGAPLLPTGVVPITAIPTYIAWGTHPLVRVSFEGGRAEEFHPPDPEATRDIVFRYVAENANPENRLKVSRVWISYPAPFLQNGIVLIDTPGIGSTLRHNTDAALRVLPECDAALFVVSVDPPITAAEIDYLRLIKPHAARIFFVLNKFDYVPAEEREAAERFLRDVLEKDALIAADEPIFRVSARFGLAAKQGLNPSVLRESGIGQIEDHLVRNLAKDKIATLRDAAGRKAMDIVGEALTDLAMRIRALELPLETLDERAKSFEGQLRAIGAQRSATRDMLMGERRRIGEELEARAADLRRDARDRIVAAAAPLFSRDVLDPDAVAAATAEFFDRAYEDTRDSFVRRADDVIDVHRRRDQELVAAVREIGAALFEIPLSAAATDEPFHHAPEPYWVSERWEAGLIPHLGGTVDRLLPAGPRRKRRQARIERQVDELAVRNVENLRWSIVRGLDETFARAASQLEGRLDEAIEATRAAIRNARALKQGGSNQVAPELDRLRSGVVQFEAARSSLAHARFGARIEA